VIRILADALITPARLLQWFAPAGMASDQIRKLLGRAGRLATALTLTATRLTELELPLDWTEQHRLLARLIANP
jgi:hypothetical protein